MCVYENMEVYEKLNEFNTMSYESVCKLKHQNEYTQIGLKLVVTLEITEYTSRRNVPHLCWLK